MNTELSTIIAKFEEDIHRLLEATVSKLSPSVDNTSILLDAAQANTSVMETLERAKYQFDVAVDNVSKIIAAKQRQVETIIKQDEQATRAMISKLYRVKLPSTPKPTVQPKQVKSLPTVEATDRQMSNIKLTPALGLQAIVCKSFGDVMQDGNLYYNTTHNHFAFKINGKLFHGGIGNVVSDSIPCKVKDCKFRGGCSKGASCDYYHNPMLFANSKDVRNYTASSWVYTKNNRDGRRFGSFDNLDVDITNIEPADRERFHDQTVHDVLCSLLLKYN